MLESLLRSYLLRLAHGLSRARGVKLTTISRELTGEPTFFENLRARKRVARGEVSYTVRLLERVTRQAEERWPEGKPFPYVDAKIKFRRPTKGAKHGKRTKGRPSRKADQSTEAARGGEAA